MKRRGIEPDRREHWIDLLLNRLTWRERFRAAVKGTMPRNTRLVSLINLALSEREQEAFLKAGVIKSVRVDERVTYDALSKGADRLALFIRGHYGAEIGEGEHSRKWLVTVFDVAEYYMARERKYAQVMKLLPRAMAGGVGTKEWEQVITLLASITLQEGGTK